MTPLETNLLLWAICSIILFEILIIFCLCRFCFNRIKPKKFYIKREEYEYLEGDGTRNGSSMLNSTILRAPKADDLALVGTIGTRNPSINQGIDVDNLGLENENYNETSRSNRWIELETRFIPSGSFPTVDYDIESNDYLMPQSLRTYNADDQLNNFRFEPLRRPELILSQVARLDTSTESPGVHYSTVVPKSILKGSTNPTPTFDLRSTGASRTPSRNSVRISDRFQINHFDWRSNFFQDESIDQQENDRHISRVFVPWSRQFEQTTTENNFIEEKALEY